LPGNITVLATSAAGAAVTYSATAYIDALFGPISVSPGCFPFSGSTFPIGTTTVNCTAINPVGPPPLSFPTTGSFTVTVAAGSPSLALNIANKGRDLDGSFWVDLRLTNTGTGHARNVNVASLTLQMLTGTGAVSYNAARSGPLPMAIGSLDVGETRTVRLYLNVPATILRFSITEGVTLQNVIGTTLTLSAGQAVFP